jgi:hypothetical protein
VKELKRKILGLALVIAMIAVLATPLAAAKPTIKSVEFRIESWPAPTGVGDYSKLKAFPAGESGNSKMIKGPTMGVPPLLDDIPDSDPAVWVPYLMSAKGGVRLTIDGMGTREGIVEAMVIHDNTFADGSWSDSEKCTFTFAEGTLEISAKLFTNGMGKCVGTRGTGIFEEAKFTGTFEVNLYWYYLALYDLWAGFKIQEGTGELMFP